MVDRAHPGPLTFRPRGDGYLLAGLLGTAAVAAAWGLAAAPDPARATALAAALLVPCLAAAHSVRQRRRLRRCHCYPGGRLLLEGTDGSVAPGQVVSWFAHPWLVAMEVRTRERRYRLLIPRGAIHRRAHRRLRAWLWATR